MIQNKGSVEITTQHNGEELRAQTTLSRKVCNYCNGTGEILHVDEQNEREFVTCSCCRAHALWMR
jgi:hypothetical protein